MSPPLLFHLFLFHSLFDEALKHISLPTGREFPTSLGATVNSISSGQCPPTAAKRDRESVSFSLNVRNSASLSLSELRSLSTKDERFHCCLLKGDGLPLILDFNHSTSSSSSPFSLFLSFFFYFLSLFDCAKKKLSAFRDITYMKLRPFYKCMYSTQSIFTTSLYYILVVDKTLPYQTLYLFLNF